jgi:hypothetical protein
VKRLGLAAFLLALVAAPVGPARAAVDDAGPGVICQYSSMHDPLAAGTQSGQLSGGPLVLTDSTTGLPGSGTLTCRIQVNMDGHTGTGPFVSGHGTGVVATPPSVVRFAAAESDLVYLCGEFTDDSDGTTYYWDAIATAWTTDPAAPCEPPAVCDSCGNEPDLLDLVVCPFLAVAFPPEGDVPGIWDCPPYGN